MENKPFLYVDACLHLLIYLPSEACNGKTQTQGRRSTAKKGECQTPAAPDDSHIHVN